MKKRRLFPLFAASLLLLLSACQSTPTQSAVTGKDNRVFLEKAKKSAEIPADTTPERVQYQEEFTSTDGSVTIRLDIDTELPYRAFPVVEVAPHFMTGEEVHQAALAAFPDASFYEQDPTVENRYSKADLREKIALWTPYATMEAVQQLYGTTYEADEEDNKLALAQIQGNLRRWNEMLETAPEERPLPPCAWTFQSETHYGLPESGNMVIYAAVFDDINHLNYNLMADNRDKKDFRLSDFGIQLGADAKGNDLPAMYARLTRTAPPTQEQIEAAKVKAQIILDRLEAASLGQWELTDTNIYTSEGNTGTVYEIQIKAAPVYCGITTMSDQSLMKMVGETDYAPRYEFPRVYINYSANGELIYYCFGHLADAQQVINENVAMMPREELMAKAINQFRLSDAKSGLGIPGADLLEMFESFYKEDIVCEMEVTSVRYALGRIKAPGDDDTYYYTPFFILGGKTSYYGKDSGTLYVSSTDYGSPDQPLICLNAIDGTVVSF